MFRSPEPYPRIAALGLLPCAGVILTVSFLFLGCGELTCPQGLVDDDGTCVKREVPEPGPGPTERCDGVDNDGDEEVDEDWPELDEACGEGGGVGECVEGMFVCAEDGAGVVCEGAKGPTAEVCDGKDNDCDGTLDNGPDEVCDGEDNDCDGFVDEGVLTVKKEGVFDALGSVAAVDGGFVVTRAFQEELRVETYDFTGSRTGHHDDIAITPDVAFIESDGAGSNVYLTWGKLNYFAAEAQVDPDLIPIVVGPHQLHKVWDQPSVLFAYQPPFHPRVLASSRRLVGYEDPLTFSIIGFGSNLGAVTQLPSIASEFPIVTAYDAAGIWVAWEVDAGIEGAWLINDGTLERGANLGPGFNPGLVVTRDGPAMVSLEHGDVQLSELDAVTLKCRNGGLCNARLPEEELLGPAGAPADLAYHEATDTWFVVAGGQIIAVGRDGRNVVVHQLDQRTDLDDFPNLVDIVVSGDTVAVMQSSPSGDSALTFLGCL